LFVYLVCNRLRPVTRHELVETLWPEAVPAASQSALSALLSKLRRVVPTEVLPDAFVDYDAALEALHRAESGVARGAFADAWGPARVALHTATRGFLPGEDAPWIDERRRHLEDVRLAALELTGEIGLGLGGGELPAALRSGRTLVEQAPLRESGYRLLMRALTADGNAAEALAVYDALRLRLREELGTAPSAPTQALHRALLR
jgi:DNA-binding SARP family transcriptional activator